MEIRGVTHLKAALYTLYYGYPIRTYIVSTKRSHVYTHHLCSIESSGRVILPLARDFSEFDISSLDNRIDKYIFPLIPTSNPYIRKKTADPLVKSLMMDRYSSDESVKTVMTYTGEKYYGGAGYILDSEFAPLTIFGIECIKESNWRIQNPVCVINPVVFQREDMVSKYIVKKLIPYMSDFKLNPISDFYGIDGNMKLMITPEIDKFIISPSQPTGISMDRDLWECANEYKDEILL